MEDIHAEIQPEKMHAPSYKLLVATPMAAIMVSNKDLSKWSGLLASIAPIYATAAQETTGEVQEALATVSSLLNGGEALIRQYFDKDSLAFEQMLEISATGADVWMCKLSDGEISKADVIRLFRAIQAGLVDTVGDCREDNEMIDQMIQVQDKVIEHISSLN